MAQKVVDAPPPADSQAQRLTQMRQIARRFSGSRFYAKDDTATELRLLPAPLYRYTAEEVGIQDGGLFAFVIGDDPELLLLLDAIREGEGRNKPLAVFADKDVILNGDRAVR